MRNLYKSTSTKLDEVTVFIHQEQTKEIVGRVWVSLVDGESVKITVSREDEAWFGSVKLEVI